MHRAVLVSCFPWLALLLAGGFCLWLTARLSGARLQLGRMRQVHRDEAGSVQSFSFVLTLPIFVMFLLFIVQVSQVMIGTMVVNYAAFAAARAAIVWIPADFGPGKERANCISMIGPGAEMLVQNAGDDYLIQSDGPKFQKIQQAAVLACMPISPSRPLARSHEVATAAAVKSVYQSIVPASKTSQGIPRRLENKLTYSLANTSVRVTFLHKADEPPIARYNLDDDPNEFYENEVGWQDPITVTVTHRFALMPGPGRLLSKPTPGTKSSIQLKEKVYTYPIQASATLTNEGEKPVLSYVHIEF